MQKAVSPISHQCSVAGQWHFELDPTATKGFMLGQTDGGMATLADTIQLPGSTDEAGQGMANTKTHLDHLSRSHIYVGPAWYQREISIPDNWQGKHIRLFLERCHWESAVWLDKDYLGTQNSLSAPHIYDLGKCTGTNTLTIRIDNTPRIPIGNAITFTGSFNLAHAITDHTQTNWNGIIGRIELQAYDPVHIAEVQIYPDGLNKTARVLMTFHNQSGQAVSGKLHLRVSQDNHVYVTQDIAITLTEAITQLEHHLELPTAPLWDEFEPTLLSLLTQLETSEGKTSQETSFGLRSFYAKGKGLYLNGQSVFLRGTLECCVFPLTGYPPMDKASWLKVLNAAKAHGLNHLRFHSWCPPKAAFEAADELGFFLQIEGPFWAAFGHDPHLDSYAYTECKRILTTYGNHPSFCMLAITNEPSGANMNTFFAEILEHLRKDTRHIYTSGAGWPMLEANDFHVTHHPRAYQWLEGLSARFNARSYTSVDYHDFISEQDKPVISHEIGQWTSYPDYDQIEKYTGVLKPRNLETFQKSLQNNGLSEYAKDFVNASGNLQMLLYKEEIEAALKTPDFAGFQLLDLHDFPGQGTALVGVLDAFWDNKPYSSPEAFREFCNDTVLLACFEKLTFTQNESSSVEIKIAHFGKEPLRQQTLIWELRNHSSILKQGTLAIADLPRGTGISVGEIMLDFADVTPGHLQLHLQLEHTTIHNHWDVWLYPEKLAMPSEIFVSRQLDQETIERLEQGDSVLLNPQQELIKNTIPFGFSTAFWNVAWTAGQAPNTQGVLCNPEHPALQHFYTQAHSNWQWWELVYGSKCLITESLSARPIIQVIDDWRSNRKLALAVEMKVGKGKLLICTANLTGEHSHPVSRQLLYSLQQYMQSIDFNPQDTLSIEAVKGILEAT